MPHVTNWALLIFGLVGLMVTGVLAFHFFTHRDRRRGDRRLARRRQINVHAPAAEEERRERTDRRIYDRRTDGDD